MTDSQTAGKEDLQIQEGDHDGSEAAILRSAVFLGLGTAASVAGDQVATIGLVLSAAGRGGHGSGLLVSASFLVQLVPSIVLGGLLGYRLDRLPARVLWTFGLACQGVVIAGAALVPGLWPKIVLLGLCYCIAVVTSAASFRELRAIFGARTRVLNGVVGSATSVGGVAGSAIGGVGLSVLGLRGVFFADAASFIVFAVGVACVAKAVPPDAGSGADVVEAIRWRAQLGLLRDRRAFGSDQLVVLVLGIACVSFSGVAEVFYLRHTARLSLPLYGLVVAAWAAGSALSSIAVIRLRNVDARVIMRVGAAGIGMSLAAVAFLRSPLAIALVFFGGGVANGCFNVSVRDAVHDGVPEHRLAGVWAFLGAVINASILIGYVGGGLASRHAAVVLAASGLSTFGVAAIATIISVVSGSRAPSRQ